jgi:hypothetical protein
MTLLLFKKIELVGGPLDGERFCLSNSEIVLKDEKGIKRKYVASTERTKDNRTKFVYQLS